MNDEKDSTCTAFLTRAAAYFLVMGITRIERLNDVPFSDIDITASAAAAVYTAAEAEWGTTSTSGVVL